MSSHWQGMRAFHVTWRARIHAQSLEGVAPSSVAYHECDSLTQRLKKVNAERSFLIVVAYAF